ncbi:MAG: hypothetical protein F4173_00875 [Acidobacteriia bacterium]|nr:hypothetical protein [Terriglobia bacterium]
MGNQTSRCHLEGPSARFQVLTATQNHARVLAETASEHPDICGDLAHALHTTVMTRERSRQ